MGQAAAVGRIVHYYPHENPAYKTPPGPYAAIVTAIKTDNDIPDVVDPIAAMVLLPAGQPIGNPFIPYSETPKPGHWSWPPRV